MAENNNENIQYGAFAPGDAVESYRRQGGFVLDEYLPDLKGLKGKRTMQTLIDDSTFGGFLFILSAIFRSLEWEIKLPEGFDGDADLETKREYLENVLFHDIGDPDDLDSAMTFDDLVQIALSMVPWGYALVNPVFKKRPDGLAGIKRLIHISPLTVYEWDILEPLGSVRGVMQERPNTYGIIRIDRTDFMHFKTLPWGGSPEGRSMFRPAYKSFYRRERFQTTESILAERGTGFPVIIADKKFQDDANAGNESARKLVNQLNKMPSQVRQNSRSGMTIFTDNYKNPDGTDTGNPRIKFEFAPVGNINPVDFRRTIRDYDMDIARSLMAQFMFNGSESGGSRAMDVSQTNTFMKAINGFAEIIAGVINRQLVARLWQLNGWTDDEVVPYVVAGTIDKADLKVIGGFIRDMAQAGAPLFPNEELTEYMMGLAGVPYDAQNTGGEL